MADHLAKAIAELSPEQLELFLQRFAQLSRCTPERVTRRRQPAHSVPLSSAQLQQWFVHQLAPASTAYNLLVATRLRGHLNVAALRASLGELVRRHEALRSTFSNPPGGPVQTVQAPPATLLRQIDLRHLPAAARDREGMHLAERWVRIPFDLERGPVLRCSLLRLADEESLLLLSLHHIVADGWSSRILLGELAALYAACRERRLSPLPEPALQYADYALWEHGRLASGVLAPQVAYWRQNLSGVPRLLALPTDRPRPSARSWQGGHCLLRIGPELVRALEPIVRQSRATLFMVLLAAWKSLLARTTGSLDLLVGTPIANRTSPDLETVVGPFANLLVLRTRLDPALSFRAVVERVRETAVAAFVHQDVPFDLLVRELEVERDLSRPPLVQTTFALQTVPPPDLAAAGLEMQPVAVETGAAKFDLGLDLTPTAAGVGGFLEYSRELFDASTMQRTAGHLLSLLAAAAAAPECPIAELGLLGPAERQQLVEWNATKAAYRLESCLHDWITAQARRTPEAVAVDYEGELLTYGALDAMTARLARMLVSLGVGPEVRVGICVERSLEMMIGLLGILRAGGAYVPLDPSYPAERLDYMRADSQRGIASPVLLTQRRLLEGIAQHPGRVICLDDPLPDSSVEPDSESVQAEHLAYLIYTSGSTGRPKGAMNTHRAIVNRLLWMQEAFGLTPEDRVVQKTPFSFDVSVWELFWPLMMGARLVIARPRGHQDAAYLARLLATEGVTTVHFVPSMLQVFLEAPGLEECSYLRRVIASGEALPSDLARRFSARLGWTGAALYNLYGPTEAAVDVTFWRCEQDRRPSSVPIGRPVANTRIYLLDRHGSTVPIGVPGHLHIGGVQVGRGYLNQPDLTAEKFVPDFLGGESGSRLYATGDLARALSHGAIEFLGRIDHQVKIRGFRIELGEIEEGLMRHPMVRSAVVLAQQAEKREPGLVAYVTAAPGTAPTLEDLRRALARSLPDYMLPAGLVVLERMPLTPNGKVDRAALPPAAGGTAVRERSFVAPRDRLEAHLAGLWQEVLGRKQVGVNDDFFALGGTSISGAILINRLQQDLQAVIELVAIFAAPTIAELGRNLRASHPQAVARVCGEGETADGAPAATWLPLVPVPLPPDGVVAASFAQQRLWFLDQLRSGSPAYNIPLAVSLRGPLDRVALAASLCEITRRHEALRTTFADRDGEPVQVIAAAGVPPSPRVDLSELPSGQQWQELRRLAGAETLLPFDLRRGPLVRWTFLLLAPDEHVVLLTMHHIISDGWSLGVLVKELAALYPALSRGRVSPLPELTVQYADFAVWHRQLLQGAMLTEQLEYWRRQLAGAPEGVALPLDHPRPPVQGALGRRHTLQLADPLHQAAREVSLSCSGTLFMTLQAIFHALLHRYTGESDLVTGTAIANRTRAELERLIGFFVNTLTMRYRIPQDATFEQLLEQVRETTLQAFAYQDLPFERLVEELRPQRRLDRHPLFQIVSGLQNAPLTDLELPGLELRYLDVSATATRFDLEIFWWEMASGIGVLLVYDRALWDPVSMVRLGEHFQRLAEEMVADPGRRLSEYALLSGAERAALLREWNDTAIGAPAAECVHESFAAAAERAPEAVAVACGDEWISYRELNRRANGLSLVLAQRGIGWNCRVGICMQRSIEMVVAVFGVLKTRAAYVPVDPDYPRERLRFMLADAQVSLLLTQSAILPRLNELAGEPLCLDEGWWAAAADAGNPAPLLPSAELPAYILYTSGSTGRPKGVIIPHRALAHHRRGWLRALPLDGSDAILQFASLSFDVSAEEIFPCLGSGARLVLREEQMLASVPEFLRRCEDSRITAVNLPTALWRQILACLEAGEARLPKSWRAVLFGGERADPDSVAAWRRWVGDQVRLVNVYGPTETTVTVTWGDLTRQNGHVAPLGWPLADTRLRVLDGELQPVAIGMPGELCIEGEYLAHGYLGLPAFTAERFVPSAFAESPGARLYRSGDLVRRLATGQIDFLGRIDDQIKLRGFRIELGEVEAVIREHPAVRRCKVVPDGGDHLVAYVEPVVKLPQNEEMSASQEAVKQWQRVFDETSLPERPEDTFHSWNSSYTGLPIPTAEMNVWLESTLARIDALRPRQVLEIGCGTGLLLRRIAGRCTSYLGTDFSQASLQFLRDRLAAEPLPQVELRLQPADDFTDIPADSRDVVILNSVVQYFPTAEYLTRVLTGAVTAVAPGGAVFIGDVRSLPLEEAFGLSLLIARVPSSSRREEIASQLEQVLLQQEELLIDPAFFLALARHLPQIGSVKIEPKRGRFANELTRFRYDVTLRVGAPAATPGELQRLDWQAAGLSLAGLRRLLNDTAPPALLIERIENTRLTAAVAALRWLREGAGGAMLGELRQPLGDGLQRESAGGGVDPEDLWDLEREVPYHVELSWMAHGADGCVSLLLLRRDTSPVHLGFPPSSAAEPPLPWSAYTNRPLRARLANTLVPQLREQLLAKLPPFMAPASFVMLDELPMLPSGKVDRRALPAPQRLVSGRNTPFVPPRDALERQIIEIWEQVLGLQPIGIRDNFFDLGGHSLLAIRMMSRLERVAGRAVPVAALFRRATIEELADGIRQAAGGWQPQPSLLPLQPLGERPPLCLLHPAGGTLYGFLGLARRLGPSRPIFGLQAQGLDGRSTVLTTVESMASHYRGEMRDAGLQGPYLLVGWSFGGIVALEIARQLRAAGDQVELVVMLDTAAPGAGVEPPADFDRKLLVSFAEELGLAWRDLAAQLGGLIDGDPHQWLVALDEMPLRDLLPPELAAHRIGDLFQVFRANMIAAERYIPGEYEGRIVLVSAADGVGRERSIREQWSGLIPDELVETYTVPGGHHSMMHEPQVGQLAELLTALGARAGEDERV